MSDMTTDVTTAAHNITEMTFGESLIFVIVMMLFVFATLVALWGLLALVSRVIRSLEKKPSGSGSR